MSLGSLKVPQDLSRIATGSTKDIYKVSENVLAHAGQRPSETSSKMLFFDFSDRISVFDYGALPEEIPSKGLHLEVMARHFESVFQKAGIPSAYDSELSEKLGGFVCRAAGGTTKLNLHETPKNSQTGLSFVPLECIFRWGSPRGSSLFKRYPQLKVGEIFENPLIEFSTKLENYDRLLSDEKEICAVAGFSQQHLENLKKFVAHVAQVLKNEMESLGLVLWDGKIEVAWDFDKNEFCLVDALTLDEIRVTLKGLDRIPLSKELARQWLSRTRWGAEIDLVKAQGIPADKVLKQVLTLPPPRLGPWRLEVLSSLYGAFCEALRSRSSKALWYWVRGEGRKPPRVYVSQGAGREAALVWRLQSEGAQIVEDPLQSDACLVSMDAELEKGAVNSFQEDNLWVWAPSREAAQIEWSKIFGREIAKKAGIATPQISVDPKAVEPDSKIFANPPVVKFDGLAAGKGVVVPQSWQEAQTAYKNLSPGGSVLFEEKLEGPEASAFFGVTTKEVVFLGSAQDFKRRYAGDEGPNTGGMGAYVPSPLENEEARNIWQSWAEATVEVLKKEGKIFEGVLYLGLMKDLKKGWVLIEYNARPGDPETQGLVFFWPAGERVLLSFLGLDLTAPKSPQRETEQHCVVLSLVHPEYPAPPQKQLHLPAWDLSSFAAQESVHVFLTKSLQGRVAYIVGKGASRSQAADPIFSTLIECPWKSHLEWRADIL